MDGKSIGKKILKKEEREERMEELMPSSEEANVKVFNRALVWKTERDGFIPGIIVYGEADVMRLTGIKEVSSWIIAEKDTGANVYQCDLKFNRLVAGKPGTFKAVLREFEWPVDQYPVMNFAVRVPAASWNLSVIVPSRTKPLWQISGPAVSTGNIKNFTFDLRSELRKRGYSWQFMRLNVEISSAMEHPGAIDFSIEMPAASALVAQLPVAITRAQSKDGFMLGGILLDDRALPINGSQSVCLTMAGRTYPLSETGKTGFYQTQIHDLECGEYTAQLSAMLQDNTICRAAIPLSVNEGQFGAYDPGTRHYVKGGKTLGFLAGDIMLCGNVPFFLQDDREMMVNGMAECSKLSPTKETELKPVSWTGMTPEEISRRLTYLGDCGYRGMKIANWAPTLLDAGGRVSPFGIEFISFLLRESARTGIHVIVDIYHDWLGWEPGTVNLDAYYNAGFLGGTRKLFGMINEAKEKTKGQGMHILHRHVSKDLWMEPSNIEIFKGYFEQFLRLFKNDTRILAYSPGGEGDASWTLGPLWANMLCDFVRTIDRNHVVTIDQMSAIGIYDNEPAYVGEIHMDRDSLASVYNQRLRKIMHVAMVGSLPSDLGMLVNLKYVSLDPGVIHGEGDCYASLPWRSDGKDRSESPNLFSEAYRLMVRDALWMSLLNRIAFYWNWGQVMTEDEYLIPAKVSDMINWAKLQPAVPPVYIRIWRMTDETPQVLVNYEKAFGELGLQLGYIYGRDVFPDGRRSDFSLKGNPPYHVIDLSIDGMRKMRKIYEDDISKWPRPEEFSFIRDDLAAALIIQYDERHAKTISAGGRLPDNLVRDYAYVEASKGYLPAYLISREKDTLIAYVRNTTNYETHPEVVRIPSLREKRKEILLSVKIKNLSKEPLVVTVFDIDTKGIIKTVPYADNMVLDFGRTTHDYCVVVSPR